MELEKLVKTLSCSNSFDGKILETTIILDPYFNWENLIYPAPVSIAIVGKLMLIANSSEDFKLQKSANSNLVNWKYIRNPVSFRASVLQLANDLYDAFLIAHTNIDQIRIQTLLILENVKCTLNTLCDSKQNISELPNHFSSVQDFVQNCSRSATEVSKRFIRLSGLANELLEACEITNDETVLNLQNLLSNQDKVKHETEVIEEQQKKCHEHYKELKEAVSTAIKDYHRVEKEAPNPLEVAALTGLDIAEHAVDVINMSGVMRSNAQIELARSFIKIVKKKVADSIQARATNQNVNTTGEQSLSENAKILTLVSKMLIDLTSPSPETPESSSLNRLQQSKGVLPAIRTLLNAAKTGIEREGHTDQSKELTRCCSLGECVVHNLETILKDAEQVKTGRFDTQNLQNISLTIVKLCQESQQFYTAARNVFSSNNSHSAVTPNLNKCVKVSNDPTSLEYCLEHSTESLKAANKALVEKHHDYILHCKTIDQHAESHLKLLTELNKLDFQNATLQEIRATLRKGLLLLQSLDSQWSTLIRFFHEISNIIKVTFEETNQLIVDLHTDYENKKKDNQSVNDGSGMLIFLLDVVFELLLELSKVVSHINHVTSIYFDISENILMKNVISLESLCKGESGFVNTAMAKLDLDCESTIHEIKNRSKINHEDIVKKLEGRIQHLKSLTPAALAGDDEADVEILTQSFEKFASLS